MMRRVLTTLLLLLTALVPVGIIVAGDSTDPGRPGWVGSAGAVESDKVPAELAVAGPDGKPVVCANGKELKVKKSELLGPPPSSGRPVEPQPGDFVWRCGTGKNPHLHARLVPESLDPLDRDGG
ncbi:MAG TPA: hypothetical protein VM049_04340 [Gaiellaceae bacterium]|nr:hypothetical protein [Gaiellaceae bacterium]